MTRSETSETALQKVRRVGIERDHEVLLWVPRKFIDNTCFVGSAREAWEHVGRRVVLRLTINSGLSAHSRLKLAFTVWVIDSEGSEHRLTVFGDMRFTPWKAHRPGAVVHVAVKPHDSNGTLYLQDPDLLQEEWVGSVQPIYAGKPGVLASAVVGEAVAQSLTSKANLEDAIFSIREAFEGEEEDCILGRAGSGGTLMMLLLGLHRPASMEQANWASETARRIAIAYVKFQAERASHRPLRVQTSVRIAPEEIDALLTRLPFKVTTGERSQHQAIHSIGRALSAPYAMDAILSADVGVGKTLCYMVPAVATQRKGHHVCVLVPNTLLAEQIFGEFRSNYPEVPVMLVTDATRKEALEWDKNPVLIGTTRLFSVAKKQRWKPHFLVIDEQQKLSIEQRAALCDDKTNVLEVSATPVPNTLALLKYGGKQRIEVDKRHAVQDIRTFVAGPEKRSQMFDLMKRAVAAGHQVALIYPRVEVSQDKDASSVIKAAEQFERLFPGQVVSIHGKMTTEEKTLAMNEAKTGVKSIIVSSSIIEIGVTIENLRMMIVVDADRFGLSTLHQMRGRMARKGGFGLFIAYLSKVVDETTLERILTLGRTTNGFELAKLDMLQRGFGDLSSEGTDSCGRSRTLFRSLLLMPQDFEAEAQMVV